MESTALRVFYAPEQNVSQNDSFSPSASKPAHLVAQWQQRFGTQIKLIRPQPVSLEELCLAHDRDYVESVLSCREVNGFYNRSPEVASSLPWTSGSLVSAARHVLQHGGAACSPTSGFHHATYRLGMGFCTFNGLMVAAIIASRQVERVGILDCDYHYGNGTTDILEELQIPNVAHYTTGSVGGPTNPERFLQELPQLICEFQVGLLLYQAGADAHIDDPLGGWMTSEQMRRRDRIVFETCRRHGIPVVWNLAGGYQEDLQKVLDLHHATMEECLAVFSGLERIISPEGLKGF